jgi:heme A synthase
MEMIVELTHRVTSGASGLLVVVQLVWAFLAFPGRHPARLGAVVSMILMGTEGAIGAALVKLEHVNKDASVGRAVWISLHLCNTFLLVAAMVCTAYWASTGRRASVGERKFTASLVGIGAAGLMLVGVSGAITALGDTLFKDDSLARGVAADFSPHAHFLQQLRVLHPILAVVVAIALLYARGPIAAAGGPDAARVSRWLAGFVVAQLALGVVNFALRAPASLQLVHLLVADLVWITFVLLGAAALASDDPVPDRGDRPHGAPAPG